MQEQDKTRVANVEKNRLPDAALETIVGGKGGDFNSFVSFMGGLTKQPLGNLDPATRISDVMDSLTSVEAALALEEQYGVSIPNEMLTTSLTFGQAYSFLTKG
jgi:acyl carrier protein